MYAVRNEQGILTPRVFSRNAFNYGGSYYSFRTAAPSHQHPSLFHLVSVLQQDAALAETLIVQGARGQAPAKRQRRAVQLHQRRLQQLCFDVRDGRKTVPETLDALGHCVRLF